MSDFTQGFYWGFIVFFLIIMKLGLFVEAYLPGGLTWISTLIIYGSAFSLGIFVSFRRLDLRGIGLHNRVTEENFSFFTFNIIIIIALTYFNKYLLILYLLYIGLDQRHEEGGLLSSKKFFERFLLFLIFIYAMTQLWFMSALINTISSDENLLNNDILKTGSLLFSSLGFGLLLARIFKNTGTKFFMPIIIGGCIMFYGQDYLLNYWANKQTTETKISALNGILAKNVIINHSGIPGEQDTFKTPERIRIEMTYLPALITRTLSDKPYETLIENSDYIVTLALEAKQLNNQYFYEKSKKLVTVAWGRYPEYLKLAAMTKSDESSARKFIKNHILGSQFFTLYKNYSAKHPSINDAKSCKGIANAAIKEVENLGPKWFSVKTKLRNERGRQAFINKARSYGLELSPNWSFSNIQNLRNDLTSLTCKKRDKEISKFENEHGISLLKNGKPYTITEFIHQLTGAPNIEKLEDYDMEAYKQAKHTKISSMSPQQVINHLQAKQEIFGNDFFKAAMMPAVGLVTSFTFLVLNIFILFNGILRELYVNRILRRILLTATAIGVLTISNIINQGFWQAGINLQEITYRHSNHWFSKVGLAPSLIDQTDVYRSKMSMHHLRLAESAVKNNLLTTPPSRSALFHITIAKYYDKQAKTSHLLEGMLKRYQELGAENKESQLNERYEYIKRWNNIYL